jgi:hypothetical protein
LLPVKTTATSVMLGPPTNYREANSIGDVTGLMALAVTSLQSLAVESGEILNRSSRS